MMNKGIRCIGASVVIDYIERVSAFYNLPIVSVGSGMARIEQAASRSADKKNIQINWVCVDPDPTSFLNRYNESPCILPSFAYVKDLIKEKPEIVGNCVVFLNWCVPNESIYDFEAIKLLSPVAVLTIYERCGYNNGAAGGISFHGWLEKIWDNDCAVSDIDTDTCSDSVSDVKPVTDLTDSENGKVDPVAISECAEKYIELVKTCLEDDDDYDHDIDPQIAWIHRKDCEKPSDEVINNIPKYVFAQESTSNDCSIM